MNRRSLREQVFKLLFRVEFNPAEELEEQCCLFFAHEELQMSSQDEEFIRTRFSCIREKLEEIDALINQKTRGWTTGRMGKVDLAIIRLAIYEMKYDGAIPEGVAINEAVELAKKFGQEESAGFVNGVLANFVESKQD